MADRTVEYHNNSTETRRGGSGALAFVVGALVVLVAVIAYVIFGSDADFTPEASAPSNIEINTNADSAAAGGSEAAAPAADADADASANAPADGGASAGAAATAD
ncbi:hypothetical protein [Pseudooceanicola onchidii]|uniref:hypothetical protein n=1 Tax=Pseudooceanicola onchidii TaxID=2562279 RepID=UPI0010A9A53F|nr:hypothetical protein [Pseudooceanicola onchidii]